MDKVKGRAPHSYLLQGYTYGFLTVLELTWLLMRRQDEPTTLYISMAFKRSGVDPSVAQALYWLIHQVGPSGAFQALSFPVFMPSPVSQVHLIAGIN